MIQPHSSLLAAALLAAGMLLSCNPAPGTSGPPATPAVPVNASAVTREKVVGIDTYPGTVVPLQEVELRPQVSGYITRIFVQDGQPVRKGQSLYEIDRTKYRAAYDQARAAVESAQAGLERAEQDAGRYENLGRQNAVARQRVDYARTDLKTARTQVAAAEASLSGAATDLRYSLMTAPVDGVIGISRVRVGAQVSPGQTLLNTVSSDDPIAVDFVISQDEIPRFTRLRGGKAPADSLFTLGFADGTAYEFPGRLAAIDRAVDRQTGTITVRVRFPNPARELVAGMSVVVRVLNRDAGEQVVIPHKAVTEQVGEYYAFVVRGDSVEQRKLTLGTAFADKIVVRGGLDAGERVVVQGIQRLRQGAKITLDSTGAAGAGQTAAK
ncbi:MAG: RND efflux system, membrane fusion protein CmeA [uncultured Cytophagales bacterium]|uniref:RND efflux system, membrane fusion protein CmeA n=1 Tax=uncultured Cytophagales bacterium TaxID=158755 RepID=A0A6J4LMA3_9SPHI|nr:MAG: RND efflux system, membrane fusion protein CmeA [uncultured Cytophagales bacterium]